jgi:hypothetical protein
VPREWRHCLQHRGLRNLPRKSDMRANRERSMMSRQRAMQLCRQLRQRSGPARHRHQDFRVPPVLTCVDFNREGRRASSSTDLLQHREPGHRDLANEGQGHVIVFSRNQTHAGTRRQRGRRRGDASSGAGIGPQRKKYSHFDLPARSAFKQALKRRAQGFAAHRITIPAKMLQLGGHGYSAAAPFRPSEPNRSDRLAGHPAAGARDAGHCH